MDRTRIRWSNLARLAGGLGAGAVALAAIPGMLSGPEPTPLPADVGLDPSSAGVGAVAPPAERRPRDARDPVAPPPVPAAYHPAREPGHPAHHRRTPPVEPPPAAPTNLATPPAPVAAVAPPPSPPAPVESPPPPDESPPDQPSSDASAPAADQGGTTRPPAASQFGFER
jgi:hypothetical protein